MEAPANIESMDAEVAATNPQTDEEYAAIFDSLMQSIDQRQQEMDSRLERRQDGNVVADLQQEVHKLSLKVELITRDVKHLQKMLADERELTELRIELAMLKLEKRLTTQKNKENQ